MRRAILSIGGPTFPMKIKGAHVDKTISRILKTLSGLVLLYLGVVVVASVTQLANAADRIYLGMGQHVFWLLITALLVLLIAPVAYYFKLPKPLIPPTDSHQPEYDEFLTELRMWMQRNPRLQGMQLDSNDEVTAALDLLALEANRVVRETAGAVLVGTAVMQNGRLDGMIVMATQVRMVWRIAAKYRQRPSPREMLYLYSNVGAAALMADSIQEIDFSELATPLVASVIPSLKGAIPGLQGIAAPSGCTCRASSKLSRARLLAMNLSRQWRRSAHGRLASCHRNRVLQTPARPEAVPRGERLDARSDTWRTEHKVRLCLLWNSPKVRSSGWTKHATLARSAACLPNLARSRWAGRNLLSSPRGISGSCVLGA